VSEALIRQAALNNASLCGKVLAAHGIASTLSGSLWQAKSAPIPFYPGLVTLAPQAALPDQIHGGIKDSFNDLSPSGYNVGITGDWWLAPTHTVPAARPTTDYTTWCRDWSGSDTSTTFPNSLLNDTDLIFARTDHGGGLLNVGGGVVGLTNTFGIAPLPALTALAQRQWPGLPVVLWQDQTDQAEVKAAQFHRLAPMRVWFPVTPG
jgi:hypothetical protein